MRCIGRGTAALAAILAGTVVPLAISGCASPGTPRPPSLHLPALVTDFAAERIGDSVELRFTAPARSTDGQPLRDGTLQAAVCREISPANPCEAVPELPRRIAVLDGAGGGKYRQAMPVKIADVLPPALRSGEPHPIAYRVQVFNSEGRSAGYSQPVFVLAGAAPDPVRGLQASGSRLGVVLRWDPDTDSAGEVLLKRQQLGPAPGQPGGSPRPKSKQKPVPAVPEKPHSQKHANGGTTVGGEQEGEGVVWLATGSSAGSIGAAGTGTLDATATRDTPYRYSAVRRVMVKDKDQALEMRSPESAPVEITWRAVYPPQAPTGLTAVGFAANPPAGQAGAPTPFAVDLIWQPVEDTDLAGYNVYRQAIGPDAAPLGERQKLNSAPVPQSAFHDASASATVRYSYAVTAVDTEGNESRAVTTVLEPTAQP